MRRMQSILIYNVETMIEKGDKLDPMLKNEGAGSGTLISTDFDVAAFCYCNEHEKRWESLHSSFYPSLSLLNPMTANQ
ncbi:hypothetical protein ACOI9X_09445 [Pseudomonas sp. P2757]|uniref:hypothetical protein n=1 Tax=unclassified Pseudomonas TaxID=196821 RepID=UPI003B5CAF57